MYCCTSGLGGNVATVTGFYRGFIHTGFPSDHLCSTLAGTTPRLQVWFRMRGALTHTRRCRKKSRFNDFGWFLNLQFVLHFGELRRNHLVAVTPTTLTFVWRVTTASKTATIRMYDDVDAHSRPSEETDQSITPVSSDLCLQPQKC